ncbi:MAG TPA: two-component system response regulator, partial [Spirochaetota bacterium]|nr:two-component system response regulator [Spirochaetota bacterium]
GLRGADIPLNARLIAVCDVYDAITDDRPYRKGMSSEEAARFMVDQKGRLFDPELVDVFLEIVSPPV